MIGCIAIEFTPGGDTLPRMLAVFDREEFALRGLRLMPCAGEGRATLRLDIGGRPSPPRVKALERQLRAVHPSVEVIHWAGACA